MKASDPDRATSGITWETSSTPYLRAQPPGEPDAWTQESSGRGSQQLIEVGRITAPPAIIREALCLSGGEAAIVRRRIVTLDGVPVELADSYYPERVATATPLTERVRIKGGAPTLLAELGYTAAQVVEEVESRGATAGEAETLHVKPGWPVLTLLRTSTSATGEPFEASLMVMRGPRAMRYEMRVN